MSEAYATYSAETRADIEKDPQRSDYWLAEIRAAKKRNEQWCDWGKKVVQQYRDERDRAMGMNRDDQKVNILWSNTEVLKAALFASLGKPDVRRRFPKPGRDMEVAKQVAILLENALNTAIDKGDEEYEVARAVEDMLLPGRGVVWMEIDREEDEDGYIASVDCKSVHVGWKDFLQGSGTRWKDLPWVARGHIYTRDDLKENFPEHGDRVPLNHEADGYSETDRKKQPELFKRARVWEIWDKGKKERLFVAEDYEFVLRRTPDPYRLEGFFPCPRPLIAVETTDSAVPIPEYTLYQDQAEELNRITRRIFRLIDMLKVRGVYDASADEAEVLHDLRHAADGEFLPYKGAMSLAERGGLQGAYFFWPMSETIAALQQLYQQRDQLVQAIYEITGISDILRGATDPKETATAQRIKGQFGSMRLQKRQREVQRFVRDIYRMKAELIAEHYPPEQLEEMTGILLPPEQVITQAKMQLAQLQQAPQQQMQMQGNAQMGTEAPQQPPEGVSGASMGQVIPLQPQAVSAPPEHLEELQRIAESVSWEEIKSVLHSDLRRCYQVDIETDSTVFEDAEAEKQARMEYLTAMQNVISNVYPIMQQDRSLAPFVKEVILFASRAFKAGRTLEENLEDAFEKLSQQPPQPDPKAQAAQAKLEIDKARFQLDQSKAQQEMQRKQAEFQAEQQERQMEMASKVQDQRFDQQSKAADLEFARQQQQMDMTAKQLDLVARTHEHGLKREEMTLENLSALLDYELKKRQLQMQEREQRQANRDAA